MRLNNVGEYIKVAYFVVEVESLGDSIFKVLKGGRVFFLFVLFYIIVLEGKIKIE